MKAMRFFYLILFVFSTNIYSHDITLIGPCNVADGLGSLTINFINMLKKSYHINVVSLGKTNLEGVTYDTRKIIQSNSRSSNKICIYLGSLWKPKFSCEKYIKPYDMKIAYSMLESDAIPQEWVLILNKKFNAVIVPDEWLIPVYKKSGVKIPIYVFPCPLNLKKFRRLSITKHVPFIFGNSAGLYAPHKNQELLVQAFINIFGNNPDVHLRLHARGETKKLKLRKNILNLIKKNNIKNIDFIYKRFSERDYVRFMHSLDCYVLLSKGEGFSITPREALASGIPCILSNNTAHRTICATQFVKSINSPIKQRMFYPTFNRYIGYNYSCTISDVEQALQEVYDNYIYYKQCAVKGKKWVQQYQIEQLRPRFERLLHNIINNLKK